MEAEVENIAEAGSGGRSMEIDRFPSGLHFHIELQATRNVVSNPVHIAKELIESRLLP